MNAIRVFLVAISLLFSLHAHATFVEQTYMSDGETAGILHVTDEISTTLYDDYGDIFSVYKPMLFEYSGNYGIGMLRMRFEQKGNAHTSAPLTDETNVYINHRADENYPSTVSWIDFFESEDAMNNDTPKYISGLKWFMLVPKDDFPAISIDWQNYEEPVKHLTAVSTVPEPSSLALMLTGIIGIAGVTWRKKSTLPPNTGAHFA